MNDNIVPFGAMMVANESHIANEQVIFGKPPMNCLASVVTVRLFG